MVSEIDKLAISTEEVYHFARIGYCSSRRVGGALGYCVFYRTQFQDHRIDFSLNIDKYDSEFYYSVLDYNNDCRNIFESI